ncbi:unnamed protein product [Meganyctiphanes norvegica]|uniref:Annexin n=1 Tax=Meganyctiphanes norvegica TaxID=48144 RepID=A0AAV2PLW7_MEGNR
MEEYVQVATVNPVAPFTESADAEALRRAMKGMGTNEKVIINILAHRTSYQRQMIKDAYKTAFDRNLLNDLKSELSGSFEEVMMALMTPMPLYLARTLHKAIHGKNSNILVEILCTRDKQSIENIKSAYIEEHGTELTEDLNKLPSARIRKFLIAMITEDRNEVTDDLQVAKDLSQKLFDAVQGQSGTPAEEELMEMLTKFSHPMMRMTFREYFNIHSEKFGRVIDSKFPEDLKDDLKIVYESIAYPTPFLAKELNSAIAGAGTDDHKLIRLVVSRCEIDMGNIKVEYEKLYKESLEKAIKGDTTGDYKKTLLALIEK